MPQSNPDVRLLLAQASAFARRENHADAVSRAKLAVASATDPASRALAEEALAGFESAFQRWNRNIAERRQARIENAARDEKAKLPGRP